MTKAGFELGNLAEFRSACKNVRQRIQVFDTYDAIDDALEGRAVRRRVSAPRKDC